MLPGFVCLLNKMKLVMNNGVENATVYFEMYFMMIQKLIINKSQA